MIFREREVELVRCVRRAIFGGEPAVVDERGLEWPDFEPENPLG